MRRPWLLLAFLGRVITLCVRLAQQFYGASEIEFFG